ncbi:MULTISPECIES: DedA family protein [unclassified Coleofasciculus]|uniref:DedA family protein n=1 Tax=unclassified Coleofasciculus TaxID=2692782 RepID=UPI00187F2871|nr:MULTISPECIES: DedA family protein [unclassified Coleofasciculus]MBE9124604.1 DedA family protein [Coleofasciculus sp. LEGE 07081]MBE9147568.1 DedA family protein [Coleofasciculus sp. LEGE 07092]
MLDWITNIMNSLGYLGILMLMFLENILPPIPSEVVMPLAGFTAKQGELNLVGVIVAGMVGSVLGALPWYYIGKYVGDERLKRWANKYGKWLTLSSKEITRADRWFDKHGDKTVLFCRFVPGIRSLISVPAGLSEMNLKPFLLYTAIGTLGWTSVLASAGYALGENYDIVKQYIRPISAIVFVLLIVAFGVWVLKRRKRRIGNRE